MFTFQQKLLKNTKLPSLELEISKGSVPGIHGPGIFEFMHKNQTLVYLGTKIQSCK